MADQRIKSIADVRAWMGPAADGHSDEDVLSAFSKATGYSPATVAGSLGYDTNTAAGPWRERASSAVDSYQANLYGVGEALAGAVGATDTASALSRRRRANEFSSAVSSERSQLGGLKSSYKDVDWTSPSDVGGYVGGLTIDSAPYMAEAAVGGVAGRMLIGGASTAARVAGSLAGAGAASYPSSLGDILSNQREQSGTTDLASAAALAVPYTALNAGLGVEGRIARGALARSSSAALNSMQGVKGAAARTAVTGIKTAAEEGISETGQEVLNQAGRVAVDPRASMTSPDAMDRYGESFVGGAVLGGAFGAAGGGWRRSERASPGVDTPGGGDLLQAPFQLQSYGPADGPWISAQSEPAAQTRSPAPGQYELFNPNGTPTYGADNWESGALDKSEFVPRAERTGMRQPAQPEAEPNTQAIELPREVQGALYRQIADKADAGQPLTPTEENILNTYSSVPRAAGPVQPIALDQVAAKRGFELSGNPTPQFEQTPPQERPDFELQMQDNAQGSLDFGAPAELPAAPPVQLRSNQRGFVDELPFTPPEAKINTPAGKQLYGLAESLSSEGFVDEATMDQVTTLLTQSKLAQASKIIKQALTDKKAAQGAMDKAEQYAREAAEKAQEAKLKETNTPVAKANTPPGKPVTISQSPERVSAKVDKYDRLIRCLKG